MIRFKTFFTLPSCLLYLLYYFLLAHDISLQDVHCYQSKVYVQENMSNVLSVAELSTHFATVCRVSNN